MQSSGRVEELNGSYVQFQLHLGHLGIVRNLLCKRLSAAFIVTFGPGGGTGPPCLCHMIQRYSLHDIVGIVALLVNCDQKMQPSRSSRACFGGIFFDLQVDFQVLQHHNSSKA